MSFLDSDVYERINDPMKRIAIITTNFKEDDLHRDSIVKDVENIKIMLKQLGFPDKNIEKLHNKDKNVLIKKTSDHCTFGEPNEGYIMMFNLTCKISADIFRAGQSWYYSHEIHDIFKVNNLNEWSSKPKLIFNQNPMYKSKSTPSEQQPPTDGSGKETAKLLCSLDGTGEQKAQLPIDIDIFQSFSNDGDQDSYGDENGSYYIQALCGTIIEYIADGRILKTDIKDIMYDVHARIKAMVEKANVGPQTPYYKFTHVKRFLFPMNKTIS